MLLKWEIQVAGADSKRLILESASTIFCPKLIKYFIGDYVCRSYIYHGGSTFTVLH